MMEKMSFILLEKILEAVKESGANLREAQSALRAAEAMIPEVGLEVPATVTIDS